MKKSFHEDVYIHPWSLSHAFCTFIPNICSRSDKMFLALKVLTGLFFTFSDFQIVIANGNFSMDTNIFIMLTYRKILDERFRGVTYRGHALRCLRSYQDFKVAMAVCQDHYYESSKTVTRVIGLLLGIYDDGDEHNDLPRVDSQGKICGDDFMSETGKRDHWSKCSREVFKDMMERGKPSCITERAKCYRRLFMITTPKVNPKKRIRVLRVHIFYDKEFERRFGSKTWYMIYQIMKLVRHNFAQMDPELCIIVVEITFISDSYYPTWQKPPGGKNLQ